MAHAILVLNAGSSSVKFAAYLSGDPPALSLRGRFEELFTKPRFVALDSAGIVIEEKRWPADSQLGHAEAVEFLIQWGRGSLGEHRIAAAGHRIAHGGLRFTEPVLIEGDVLAALEALAPWRRCISGTTWKQFAPWPSAYQICLRSRASTLHSTAASPKSHKPSGCRVALPRKESSATVSTDFRSSTSRRFFRASTLRPPKAVPSSPTWAAGPACAPSTTV